MLKTILISIMIAFFGCYKEGDLSNAKYDIEVESLKKQSSQKDANYYLVDSTILVIQDKRPCTIILATFEHNSLSDENYIPANELKVMYNDILPYIIPLAGLNCLDEFRSKFAISSHNDLQVGIPDTLLNWISKSMITFNKYSDITYIYAATNEEAFMSFSYGLHRVVPTAYSFRVDRATKNTTCIDSLKVTLDAVEEKIAYNFFSWLPDSVQDDFESWDWVKKPIKKYESDASKEFSIKKSKVRKSEE